MILSKAVSTRLLSSWHILSPRAVVARSVNRLTSTTDGSDTKNKNDNVDSLKFVSRFKSPIVQQLWVARQEAKANAAETSTSLPEFRIPSQSMTSISYPFTTNEFLKEAYRNPWGQVRFGKILEDLE